MAAPGYTFFKHPDANVIYGEDWTDFLGASALINASEWFIEGPDASLTKDNEQIVSGSKMTIARFVGGTLGEFYTVRNKIITNESVPQTDFRSFGIRIVKT